MPFLFAAVRLGWVDSVKTGWVNNVKNLPFRWVNSVKIHIRALFLEMLNFCLKFVPESFKAMHQEQQNRLEIRASCKTPRDTIPLAENNCH